MPDPSHRQLLDVAIDVAHTGGRRTLAYFDTKLVVESKSDQTPVTIADREAEQVCRDVIARHFPNHAIRGEEGVDQPGDERFTWLIDPIDGTKSFIHGVPLYGTLVACLVHGRPSVGVIYLPALDELIAAADGEGCWWNGRRARCSDVTRIEDATILAGSITRAIDRSGAYRDLADRARLNRGWGDAFGYALVATGRAEVMLDPRISPWDCACMPPIFREAGGWSGNWNGGEDIYGPDWLACCSGVKDEVLATLRRHESRGSRC